MIEIKEMWKAIAGYEGIYEVSNLGRVRNIKRGGHILAASRVAHGYLAFNLNKHNQKRQYLAHRLVAMAFIPNPENKPQVNHIDRDKTNNTVANLEWVTAEENLWHLQRSGPRLLSEKRGEVIQRARDLWQSHLLELRERRGLTVEQLAEACHVPVRTIKHLEQDYTSFRTASIGVACKIAWALGSSVEALVGFDAEEAIRRQKERDRKSEGRENDGD